MNKSGEVPIFNCREWETERGFVASSNIPPPVSGVYAILRVTIDYDIPKPHIKHQVLYIGMSKKLSCRLSSHAILRELLHKFGYNDIWVYYQRHNKNLRKKEAQLIRAYHPPYNLVHRQRGIL